MGRSVRTISRPGRSGRGYRVRVEKRKVWFILIPVFIGLALLLDIPIKAGMLGNWGWAADVIAHGALALGILSPVLARPGRDGAVALAVLVAVLIDLDHAVVAGSLDPGEMVILGFRPGAHSLTLAAAFLLLFRQRALKWIPFALASHVLRDAYFGPTPLLWPITPYAAPSIELPKYLYLLCEAALLGLVVVAARDRR